MDKQQILDDVIAFFSGSVMDDKYSNEVIQIMNEYSMEFAKSDADYDSPEGVKELDGIIDNCVNQICELLEIN